MTYQKVTRVSGLKYFRCQHLREKTQELESSAWYIGDTQRLIVCPLCDKMHLGNTINYLNAAYANALEIRRDIEKDVELTKLFLGDKK